MKRYTIVLSTLLLALTANHANATRRGIRVDLGGAWTFPYSTIGTPQCSGSSTSTNVVLWRNFQFSGLADSNLQTGAFCQSTTTGFTGPSSMEPTNIAGLIGPNADSSVGGSSYTFENANQTRGFQWEFLSFQDGFAIVILNGLLGEVLDASTYIKEGNNLLWSAENNQFDGEYFCFQNQTYIGKWNGEFNDESSPCLIQIRQRKLLSQVVSRSQIGELAGDHANEPTISGDGRFVVYTSRASNIVQGVGNGLSQVYLFDRAQGTVTLVSSSSVGIPGNNDSANPKISPDGRFVAFSSAATNLHPSSTSARSIYLRDLVSNSLQIVYAATPPLESCLSPSMSNAASKIVYRCGFVGITTRYFIREYTRSSNQNIVIWDGSIDDGVGIPSISFDGTTIAFSTNAPISPSDDNMVGDIYIKQDNIVDFKRISVSSNNDQGNGRSLFPALSANGCLVAFQSAANNLVENDTNNTDDVFLRDHCQGLTQRISLTQQGLQITDASANAFPTISDDGRFVAFQSDSVAFLNQLGLGALGMVTVVRKRSATESATLPLSTISINGISFDGYTNTSQFSADGGFLALEVMGTNTATQAATLRQPFDASVLFSTGFESP